jgi:hypothetical protein
MTDPNAEMHKRSGKIHNHDALVSLLYALLRDHISPGDLEKLVREECEHGSEMKVFSNGWLAQYAADLAFRLDVARNKVVEGGTPVLR